MKLSKITICGFRGFNKKKEILIDNNLTIIYGPNSYGKTSISEAMEWLLFGNTSKFENNISGKTEFKGSYRNIHHPSDEPAFVEVEFFKEDGMKCKIKGELTNTEKITKYIDDQEVDSWPWENPKSITYSPFILQHALQDLLLTKPVDRYEKFSKILGTHSLTTIQNIFNSLATKYNYPEEVKEFISSFPTLQEKIEKHPDLLYISKAFTKREETDFFTRLETSVRKAINNTGEKVFEDDKSVNPLLLQSLNEKRNKATNTIFDKKIALLQLTNEGKEKYKTRIETLEKYVTKELISEYLEFRKLKLQLDLIEKAKFFNIGLKMLETDSKKCPFCDSHISENLANHIHQKHKQIEEESSSLNQLDTSKKEFIRTLNNTLDMAKVVSGDIRKIVETYLLVNNPEDKDKIKKILGEQNKNHFQQISKALGYFSEIDIKISKSLQTINEAINDIKKSFDKSTQEDSQLQLLNNNILNFISLTNTWVEYLTKNYGEINKANEKFEEMLNSLAGTEQLSLQIELLEETKNIKKFFVIENTKESLKDLRKRVTEYISKKTKIIIEENLTEDVMAWYNQIKTSGDPDVHFSGFALGGTASNHRVGINATSYGIALTSAVSSLSESKLNALGLSIKLANNLKDTSPFGFIIIDDPVQSLDDDHATQFSGIVRSLIEKHNKQVILLSHSSQWLKLMKKGMESINGIYYELTGYSKNGPHIKETEWKEWKRRLSDVQAICSNNDATELDLQRAEEEIRLAITQITSRLFTIHTGKEKNASNLNENKVRQALLACGIEENLIDRIGQTFVTVDDAHHTSINYGAKRERILRYHSWVTELGNKL
ncbi:MAG: AAA family ATPase [Candidatus Heimdallarchaeota archaeon]|nr:AAA family ATPase [Candidatus Heimdallarchaeota archaeon]